MNQEESIVFLELVGKIEKEIEALHSRIDILSQTVALLHANYCKSHIWDHSITLVSQYDLKKI